MGFTDEEAALRVANKTGAYGKLSDKYYDSTNKIFFVNAFRLLMPIELYKSFLEEPARIFLRGLGHVLSEQTYNGTPLKNNKTIKAMMYDKLPKGQIQAVAKGMATLAMPILLNEFMKAKGYEPDKPWWKWRKTVDINGIKKEQVLSFNMIVNMPLKWYYRLSTYNPIVDAGGGTPKIMQGLYAYGRWEIHPFWRSLLDIANNRNSFTGGRVYDPNISRPEITFQSGKYLFGEWFRVFNSVEGDPDLARDEKDKVTKGVLSGMMDLDTKIMVKMFGNKYLRTAHKDWITSMHKAFKYQYAMKVSDVRRSARRYNWSPAYSRYKMSLVHKWRTDVSTWMEHQLRKEEK
jgi:hypothetical protein